MPPLNSPHLPYTTLFRSQTKSARHPPPPSCPNHPSLRRSACDNIYRYTHPVSVSRNQPVSRDIPHRSYPDRKSTRLNSSHLVISYAVFCLKNKNEEIIPI